jgi:replicative DNA helicase
VDAADDLADHRPPQDVRAEQAVLGGMLLSGEMVATVAETLTGADFYRPIHASVFDAIVKLADQGEAVDFMTVGDALLKSGDLVRCGGVPYLHELTEAVPVAANAAYYARIVYERAVCRRLVEVGTRITQLGYRGATDEIDLPSVVDLAQQSVYDVTVRRGSQDATAIGDMMTPTLEEIEAAGRGDTGSGVPTGFVDLDRLLTGLQPGQLIVVAARPGLGKSTVSMDFARHAAIRAGMASAIFSLEMSKVEMVLRLLSAESRIPLHTLRSGQLLDDDWAKLAKRMAEISDAPLFVDDTPAMTLADIRAKARRLKRKHNLRLLVVDYLQLMTSAKRTESRQQEVSDLSRGLKLLAKEIECPVIAVSQLNRGPEQRQNKVPQMSDLRESGSIEQDADVVILLHRDDYYDKESPRAGEADMIVPKQRNGATDTITVAAQLHLSRFVDMAVI